jgi:hypothetical protein
MRSPVGPRQILQCPLSLLLFRPKEAVAAAFNAFQLPKEYHMNTNYIPADISYSLLIMQACRLQRLATCVNRFLFSCCRFHLPCAIAALLLSAADMSAAALTVTNGNDHGPGSLRQAILDASSGDTINFAPSVTTVNLTTGELVVDKNLTIAGPGADRLTIRRSTNAPDAFRIFHITSSTVTVFIFRLTISNGLGVDDGAGIRSSGVLTLADSTISANHAPGSEDLGGNGGGVLNDGGNMTITRCTISNNSAHYSTGSSGDIASSSGGGILNYVGGSVTITNSTISDNSCFAEDGFGLNFGGGGGGGIGNGGSMTVRNCTISGNSAGGTGLAMMGGGGIRNFGNLQITSSTIAYNSASAENGAFGGGIYGFTSTRTDSSIIALNSAPTGPDFTGGGGLHSLGYNIIGNNADAVISSQSTDQIGTPAAPIDPLLGPLADNGGLTLTHALQPGSPAINRGDPAAPPQDQRGYGRAGVPDVGAFEFGGVATTLGNISTRAFVQTGDNVLIGGFIVQGAQTKRVIIRAIGPELAQYGVPNPLFNPTLELHDGTGALIASNDNWQHTIIGGIITMNQVRDIRNSGYAPGDGRESAIIADLPPGNYTAIVRGVDNMTGVALVEVYDLSADASSVLGNISTRAFVQTGDNVMIGGFIVQGTQPKRVIVRALGPELTQYGVPDPLADPTLELHDSTGALIASNDNWQTTIIGGIITKDQVRDIQNSGHAPTQPSESAIIADLPPGNYTAIVRGENIIVGVALVEVYDLAPPF